MPISEIALHVDGSPSWSSRLRVAFDLARTYQAHLVGVGVRQPLPLLPGAEIGMIYAELEMSAKRELARDAERFAQAVRTIDYAALSEWREAEGEPAQALASSARYADLCVVSQGDLDAEGAARVELPADLALASGRPVLVVPFVGAGVPIARRALIAWNGSREAARAVGDSLPFLARADEVHVLTVSEAGLQDTQGHDLARYLARHGLRVEVHTHSPSGLSPASVILNIACELGSDLLVIGCYGHTRLREALFGGVTRETLRSMTIPVLMSS